MINKLTFFTLSLLTYMNGFCTTPSHLTSSLTVYQYTALNQQVSRVKTISWSYIDDVATPHHDSQTLDDDNYSGKTLASYDAKWHCIRYQYDGLLRNTAIAYDNPETGLTQTQTITYTQQQGQYNVIKTLPYDDRLKAYYKTKVVYDNLNHRLATFDNAPTGGEPTHLLSHRQYNDLGQLSQQDKQGISQQFVYDAQGQKSLTRYANGSEAISQYDVVDNTVTRFVRNKNAQGNWVSSPISTEKVNDSGKAIEQDFTDTRQGNAIALHNHMGVDNFGDKIAVDLERIDATHRLRSQLTHNALGQVVATQITPDASQLADVDMQANLTYDLAGNVISKQLTNPQATQADKKHHRSYQFLYDSQKRLLQERLLGDTPANDLLKRYTYDNNGNLQSLSGWQQSSPKQYQYTYQWALGHYQIKTASVTHGKTTVYDYTSTGKLKAVYFQGDMHDKIDYTYTLDGKLASVHYANGDKTLSYQYTDNGRPYRFTDAAGLTTQYHYDCATKQLTDVAIGHLLSDNHLQKISAVTYAYNALGRPQQSNNLRYDAQGLHPSVVEKTRYDYHAPLQRLSSIQRTDGNTLVENIAYTYDANGNIARREYTNQVGDIDSVDYGYNNLNRLVSSHSRVKNSHELTTSDHHYDYNLNGDLLSQQSDNTHVGSQGFGQSHRTRLGTTYNNQDQLQTRNGVAINYTDNGDMQNADNGTGYTYYADDKLKTITQNGNDKTRLTYAPDGKLESETHAGKTLTFYFNGKQLVDEVDEENRASSYLIGQSREARLISYPNGKPANVFVYGHNAHGDMTSVSDVNTPTHSREFYHYNDAGDRSNAVDKPIETASIQYNAFQGSGEFTLGHLRYLRARWLNTQMRCFLTRDGFHLMNRYGDCDENTVMKRDPSGHIALGLGLDLRDLFGLKDAGDVRNKLFTGPRFKLVNGLAFGLVSLMSTIQLIRYFTQKRQSGSFTSSVLPSLLANVGMLLGNCSLLANSELAQIGFSVADNGLEGIATALSNNTGKSGNNNLLPMMTIGFATGALAGAIGGKFIKYWNPEYMKSAATLFAIRGASMEFGRVVSTAALDALFDPQSLRGTTAKLNLALLATNMAVGLVAGAVEGGAFSFALTRESDVWAAIGFVGGAFAFQDGLPDLEGPLDKLVKNSIH